MTCLIPLLAAMEPDMGSALKLSIDIKQNEKTRKQSCGYHRGNSGIGYGIADELIAQGAKVVITGKNQNALKEAESALGANATGFVVNR